MNFFFFCSFLYVLANRNSADCAPLEDVEGEYSIKRKLYILYVLVLKLVQNYDLVLGYRKYAF